MLRRQPPLTYENALSRMAALCAKCEQCTPDLLKKMSSCGVSAGVAAKVISRLIELKFVDDRRFSKAYAQWLGPQENQAGTLGKTPASGYNRKRM